KIAKFWNMFISVCKRAGYFTHAAPVLLLTLRQMSSFSHLLQQLSAVMINGGVQGIASAVLVKLHLKKSSLLSIMTAFSVGILWKFGTVFAARSQQKHVVKAFQYYNNTSKESLPTLSLNSLENIPKAVNLSTVVRESAENASINMLDF